MTANAYQYNPGCACDWCQNSGHVPKGTPANGHSFGFGNPHVPPSRPPFFDQPRGRMPRIIALLSFYDEDPAWLTRCIQSLPKAQVTNLIALDGPYSLFRTTPRDSTAEWDAITAAAKTAGINAQIEPWVSHGNEVEKRNDLFSLAERIAEPTDWYFVIDADEFVTEAPSNVPERLAAAPFDVAAVKLIEPGHPLGTMIYPTHPKFFRAIPGLRAVRDHFTYTTPDGKKLWGNAKTARLEPRADLTSVVVEHHNQLRHTDRRRAALDYYERRDAIGIEELPAERSILADAA